jgi:hypothetical protein
MGWGIGDGAVAYLLVLSGWTGVRFLLSTAVAAMAVLSGAPPEPAPTTVTATAAIVTGRRKSAPLTAADSPFVEPGSVFVRRDSGEALVRVGFTMKGEVSAARRVRLTVTLLDAAGRPLGSRQQECRDACYAARTAPPVHGRYYLSPHNAAVMVIPLATGAEGQPIKVIVRFEDSSAPDVRSK